MKTLRWDKNVAAVARHYFWYDDEAEEYTVASPYDEGYRMTTEVAPETELVPEYVAFRLVVGGAISIEDLYNIINRYQKFNDFVEDIAPEGSTLDCDEGQGKKMIPGT